jgi:hypothetical protein
MFAKLPDDSPVREVFLFEPRHEGFLRGKPTDFIPTERRKNDNPSYLVLVGLICLVTSFLFGCHLISTLIDNSLLQHFGIETAGYVVEKWAETQDKNDSRYYVTYEYDVGTQHFRHKQEIQQGTFTRLSEGETISIKYIQNVPGTSRLIESTNTDSTSLFLLALTIILIPLGIGSIRQAHSITVNDRKLTESGSIVLGKITQIGGTVSNGRWYNAEIWYQFASPHGNGKPISDRAYKLSAPLVAGGVPAVGTRIAVLYVNNQLFHIL